VAGFCAELVSPNEKPTIGAPAGAGLAVFIFWVDVVSKSLRVLKNLFRAQPQRRWSADENGLRQFEDDRVIDEVKWSELIEVAIRTTPGGPWAEDVFWLLGKADGDGMVVPNSVVDESGLLERLQVLPSFDNKKVMEAMSSTEANLLSAGNQQTATDMTRSCPTGLSS
jgi:hypothetical protein